MCKTYDAIYEIAKFVAIPLNIIKKILFPVVLIFTLISKGVNKIESKIKLPRSI